MVDFEKFLAKHKLSLGFLLLGLILVGVGVLSYQASWLVAEPTVEILGSLTPTLPPDLTVEISGEVVRPGVYQLKPESRVNDLLTACGGLSAHADREWVGKNINLAQKLADGVKIYIPQKEKTDLSSWPNSFNSSNLSSKINLNTASLSELDTLWGIGEVTAKSIVAGRPFQRPEELVEKKIVKSNVWEKIKDQVTVY